MGAALIRDYPFVNSDTLGRRISFLKEKLSEWCHQAYLIKKAKTNRKYNVLCYRGNDLITIIGDLKKPYEQKKKKFNKRFYRRYGRKRYFIIRKPNYFRKHWNTNRRTIYRNNPKRVKECRCYACNQIRHYANECPNKFNKKKIEIDLDIENMIKQEEFIKVNKLEDLNDLHLDEDIYETDSETEMSSSDEEYSK